MKSGLRIGIVGGGPGGLMTAYHLQKYANRPVRLTVLEASDRLGGKILTPRFATSSTTYEAGAAEFYDYSHLDHDPLKELVTELGLSTTRMEGSAVIVSQKVVSNVDDVRRHLGAEAATALLDFDRRARDAVSPREFYLSDDPALAHAAAHGPFQPCIDAIADEQAKRYVQTLIHSDLATEPAKTNLEYGLQNYLMNNPAYLRLYSIDGGNERLVRELAARTQARYLLNHRVKEVGRDASGRIWIDTLDQRTTVRSEFDCVVLALPHQALQRVAFRGDLLGDAMRRHLAHYDHPAHYLRITILFDRPFWRGGFPDSFCMLDRFDGCCLYDESSRHPGCREGVLGWLVGGEAAKTMSEWSDERLIAAALDSLPAFVPDARRHFAEGRVHRWVGAVSAMPGGPSLVPLDRRHQPEPTRHPNLFVVGDYLFDSTLNGVLDSADYVARWIVSSFTERSMPRHDGFGTQMAGRIAATGRQVRTPGGRVPAAR